MMRASQHPYLLLFAVLRVHGTDTSEQACSDASPAVIFEHGTASLAVATNKPAEVEPAVPIQGRNKLVYSYRSEFPSYIGPPRSADFPLVAHAFAADGANATLGDIAAAVAALLKERLLTHGAVLLRGLPITEATYPAFVDELATQGWNPVKLGGGGTDRKDISGAVRTASEEPDEHTIEPHMDMAHSKSHPKRISFFCAAGPPPGAGGETVLTDMRAVYASLSTQGIVREFEERGGIAYQKRLWSAERVTHFFTWQQFFFTKDLDVAIAEVHKRDPNGVANGHGVIDYAEVLPAVFAHPATSEPLWFNGVHTNHASYYEEAAHVDTSDGSPMNTAFADGSPIPKATIAAIRGTFWNHSVAQQLQTGDLVFVDNMLASHGRMGWVPGNPCAPGIAPKLCQHQRASARLAHSTFQSPAPAHACAASRRVSRSTPPHQPRRRRVLLTHYSNFE